MKWGYVMIARNVFHRFFDRKENNLLISEKELEDIKEKFKHIITYTQNISDP